MNRDKIIRLTIKEAKYHGINYNTISGKAFGFIIAPKKFSGKTGAWRRAIR